MADENKPKIRSALSGKYPSSGQSALEFKYNQEKLEQENRYRVKGAAFPNKINGFNWGAFILTPVWGLFNNTPITCLIILLVLIPYVGWLIAVLFSLYCGIKGNEWAWNNKEWSDMTHFHNTQRKWAQAGIIVELLMIVISSLTAMKIIETVLNP